MKEWIELLKWCWFEEGKEEKKGIYKSMWIWIWKRKNLEFSFWRRKKTCGLGRNQTNAQNEERGIWKLRRVGCCIIFNLNFKRIIWVHYKCTKDKYWDMDRKIIIRSQSNIVRGKKWNASQNLNTITINIVSLIGCV